MNADTMLKRIFIFLTKKGGNPTLSWQDTSILVFTSHFSINSPLHLGLEIKCNPDLHLDQEMGRYGWSKTLLFKMVGKLKYNENMRIEKWVFYPNHILSHL